MPIRRDERDRYGEEYRAACREADRRAMGMCGRCTAPKDMRITRICGTLQPRRGPRLMFWRLLRCEWSDAPWIDQHGKEWKGRLPELWDGSRRAVRKRVWVRLTHAHLNQDNRDHRPANIGVLCDACHNKYDGPTRAKHARLTRQRNKDARRPFLEVYRDNEGDVAIRRTDS